MELASTSPVESTQAVKRWTSFRTGSLLDGDRIEVFVSPEGKWYKRCNKDETPDFTYQSRRIPSLPPLQLICIDNWKPTPEEEAVVPSK